MWFPKQQAQRARNSHKPPSSVRRDQDRKQQYQARHKKDNGKDVSTQCESDLRIKRVTCVKPKQSGLQQTIGVTTRSASKSMEIEMPRHSDKDSFSSHNMSIETIQSDTPHEQLGQLDTTVNSLPAYQGSVDPTKSPSLFTNNPIPQMDSPCLIARSDNNNKSDNSDHSDFDFDSETSLTGELDVATVGIADDERTDPDTNSDQSDESSSDGDNDDEKESDVTFSKIVQINPRVRPGALMAQCDVPHSHVIIKWHPTLAMTGKIISTCSVITPLDCEYARAQCIITRFDDIRDGHTCILPGTRLQQMKDCAAAFLKDNE